LDISLRQTILDRFRQIGTNLLFFKRENPIRSGIRRPENVIYVVYVTVPIKIYDLINIRIFRYSGECYFSVYDFLLIFYRNNSLTVLIIIVIKIILEIFIGLRNLNIFYIYFLSRLILPSKLILYIFIYICKKIK